MSPHTAEINKLRNIQQSLDKNEQNLVEQISRIDNNLQISEFFKNSEISRKAQLEKLQNNVNSVVTPLCKVKTLIRKENIANIDLKLVKKEMVDIQNCLQDLKNNTKTSLDSLKKEEEKLLEEMQVFEQKVEEWNKPLVHFPKIFAPKKTSATTPENISPEVKEFMNFIAISGGHENGWTVDDHNLFLKARSKTKDAEKLAEVLHAVLPDISEEEIIAHNKWYETYIELKEKKKNAIQNWRKNKSDTGKNKNSLASKCEQSLTKSFSNYLKKDELQHKITAWKAEKRAEIMKKQQEKLQEELRKKDLEKQQRIHNLHLKTEVNKWKYSRQAAEEEQRKKIAEMRLREQEEKAARANKMIKQFRSQDEIIIQKKMQLRQNAGKSPEVEMVVKPEVPRDPQRLFKPTRQWILRSYGTDKSGNGNNNLSLQTIPKLGIPEWRKNII